MKYKIADIKAVMKRKMFQYANCNLSKNNPYYVNDGAIKAGEFWFKEFAEIKDLPANQIKSIEDYLKTLKNKYLFN